MDLLAPLAVIAVLLAPVLALAAVLRTGENRKRLEALERQILSLQRELHAARPEHRPAPTAAMPGPEPVPVPAAEPVPFVAPAAVPVAPTGQVTPPPLPPAVAPPPVPPTPPVTSLESRIGARWLSIAGAAALFLGTVFLLKWTIDQGWFGPRARLTASTVLGVGLWLGGLQWRRRYAWLGASLMGAGSCVLYATAWAGDVLWDLLSPQAAWGAMLAVTAATLLGSHLLRLLPLALIGLGGGFLAPWLVQLDATSPHGLLVWSTVLALGAAFLRVRHEWGWMLPLAAVGNCLHAVSWTALRSTHDTTVQLWAAGFVLLALGAGSLRNVLRVQTLRLADNLAALLASGMWLVLAVLAEDRVAGWLTCTVATALAAVLTAAALRHRRALPADRVGTDGLWLPAGLLLLASVPFAFEGHALAIGLGVHATVLGLLAVAGASPTLGAVAVLGLGVATWVCVLDRWDPGMWPDAQLPKWAPWTSAQFLVELLLVALFGAVLRACVRNQRFALAVATGIATSILVWQGTAGNCMATLKLPGWYELLAPVITPVSFALGGVPVVLAIGTVGTRGRWSLPVGATACALMLVPTLLASGFYRPASEGLVLHYTLLLVPVLAALWTGARTQPQAPADWNHFLLSPVCWSFLLVHLLARECYHGMAPLAANLFAAAVVLRGIAFLAVDRSVPWRGLLQATPVVAALPLATMGLVDLLGAILPWQAVLLEPPPPRAALPLGLAFALPPALCAIAMFRQGRSRRAPLWLAGLASVLSLVAVRELEVAWQAPVALVAPCMTLLLLALAVFGPGSFRSTWRTAFAPLSSLLAMLAVLTAEAWRRGAELSVNPNHGGNAGVSIAWIMVAAAWLASGFALRSRVLRLSGLALFAVTLTKLTLVDLAALPVPFRILSFLGLGGALLGCGWLYNRFARRIEPTGATQPGQAPPS